MATKYLIFSVIFIGYAIYGYNRKCVSFAIPKLLLEDVGHEQIGLIMSSQNLAYAISKFFGGIISDQLSSRILFSSGLFLSGLTAILFSMVDSVSLFTLAWFINGLAQGVGWPAIAKLLKNWFDPSELGTWWSLASASANLSGCLAPFLASYLIINYGWRFSIYVNGMLTLAIAVVAYLFLVDKQPQQQDKDMKINSPEEKRSLSKKNDNPKPKESRSALRQLLASPFVWVVAGCYLIVSSIKTSLTDWSQVYLIQECGQSSLTANSFVSSVEFGGFFGGIAAGYLSDLYMKKTLGNSKVLPPKGHPRMTVAILFAIITAACLHLFYFNINKSSSAMFVNQIGIFLGGSVYGQIALFGVIATQSVASEMSGTSHAIAALSANFGSIAAGLPFAYLAKLYSWSQVFLILEGAAVITFVFMILTRKVSYRIASTKEDERKTQ